MKNSWRPTVSLTAILIVVLAILSFNNLAAAIEPPTPSVSAGGATLRLSPARQRVGVGDDFYVDVMIDNAVGLGGFEVTLTYNPAFVRATGATLGSFLRSCRCQT